MPIASSLPETFVSWGGHCATERFAVGGHSREVKGRKIPRWTNGREIRPLTRILQSTYLATRADSLGNALPPHASHGDTGRIVPRNLKTQQTITIRMGVDYNALGERAPRRIPTQVLVPWVWYAKGPTSFLDHYCQHWAFAV